MSSGAGVREGARILVHATSVVLGTASAPFGGPQDGAVLLMGASGSGKSDVALRLIAMGGRLLSDDQTALVRRGGRVFAEAPDALRGLLEVRGVGIVPVPTAGLSLVVLAVNLDQEENIERLPDPALYEPAPALGTDLAVPLIHLRPFEASTPAKIAAAAAAVRHGKLAAPP